VSRFSFLKWLKCPVVTEKVLLHLRRVKLLICIKRTILKCGLNEIYSGFNQIWSKKITATPNRESKSISTQKKLKLIKEDKDWILRWWCLLYKPMGAALWSGVASAFSIGGKLSHKSIRDDHHYVLQCCRRTRKTYFRTTVVMKKTMATFGLPVKCFCSCVTRIRFFPHSANSTSNLESDFFQFWSGPLQYVSYIKRIQSGFYLEFLSVFVWTVKSEFIPTSMFITILHRWKSPHVCVCVF